MKYTTWISTAFVFVVLGLGFYFNYSDSKNIAECSHSFKGVVSDKYYTRSRGHFIRYVYQVDDKRYEHSTSVKDKFLNDQLQIGDSIFIKYSCKEVSISEIDMTMYLAN